MTLKDRDEESAIKEKRIVQIGECHFQSIFSMERPRDYAQVLQDIPQLVTAEIHNALVRTPMIEEVEVVAFNLGTLKAPGRDNLPGLFYQKILGHHKR